MNIYKIRLVAQVEADLDDAQRGAILDHVADVTDELMAIEEKHDNLADSDMSVSLRDHEIRLSVDVVDVSDLSEAVKIGMSTLRSAIHAAGGGTPGWELQEWSVAFPETDGHNDLIDA